MMWENGESQFNGKPNEENYQEEVKRLETDFNSAVEGNHEGSLASILFEHREQAD